MAFPVSPTNGQITVVNNITYQFSNVGNTWTRLVSTANTITANIITANTLNINTAISVTGNVTGNYILGNGSLLTGIATGSSSNITNGTSNVVVAASGNVTVAVAGTPNVAVFASTGEYITGVVSASGNITGGNIVTSGLISATGTLSVSGNTTMANISAGNISAGSITLGGLISATGNITGGNLSGTSIAGTLTTAAQTNITSVGTLGSLAVTANITGGNVLTAGLISSTGNITGGNITIPGSANISTFIGNAFFGSVPAQPTYYTIAPLNLNNSLAAATKVQLNLINTGGGAGAGSAIDFYTYQISVAAANAEARIAGIDDGNYAAYLSLQTKTPGSTGTNGLVERVKVDSTGASVVGNVTGGNVLTGGLISAGGTITGTSHLGAVVSVTGNITGGNLSVTGNVLGSLLPSANITYDLGSTTQRWRDLWLSNSTIYLGNSTISANATAIVMTNPAGGQTVLTGASGASSITGAVVSATGNVTGGNILTAGAISATGAITGAALTGTSLTVSTGNIGGGNINNNNSNGVGNIGSATVYFNTVFGKATTAQYADLAELYSADAEYTPGTVLDFGGAQEVTLSSVASSARVAGVVSTNPAHLMNSVLESQHTVAVALTGRVPTSVTGTVCKGDMMVSAGNGSAQASAAPAMGTVIGKALENFDGVSGVIEIVVGRL